MNGRGGSELEPRGTHIAPVSPRQAPVVRRTRSGWRPTLVLGAIMLGWLLIMMVVSTAAGQSGKLPAGQPVSVAQGVTVRPPSGWSSAAKVWNVGPNGVSMQKGGVIVVFAAGSFTGTSQQLLDDQLGQLKQQFSYFQSLIPDSVTVAGSLAGRRELFNGTQNGASLDGEMVAVSAGGTGVVMLAIAPTGQLSRLQGDFDQMLRSLGIPR